MTTKLVKIDDDSGNRYRFECAGEVWEIYKGGACCVVSHAETDWSTWIVGDVHRAAMIIQNWSNDPEGYWLKWVKNRPREDEHPC